MKNSKVDPRVVSLLDELKPFTPRDPHAAARARARFLAEAVSARENRRHSLWTIFQQKEQILMKLVVFTLVIVGLLFGGNATVSAAQDDLPNEPLYRLKLVSEDVNLWFESDPVQQINILMSQAQERIQEMETLALEGIAPPAETAIRAQERIQRALQIAAELEEQSQVTALQQIRTRLQTQEQLVNRLHEGTCTSCEPVLQQTRDMLQLQLRTVNNSLATPQPIQNQNQLQNQIQNQIRTTQTPQSAPTVLSTGTCTPMLDGTGQQNGGGNPSAGTPVPQNNQNNQTNQNGSGAQNGAGSGGGGGSSSDSGGQGGGSQPGRHP